MSVKKILVLGIFGILAVMVITATIHLIAPYVAVLIVIYFVVRQMIPGKKPPDEE